MEQNKIYYVGQVIEYGTDKWHLQGIFSSQELAHKAVLESGCRDCFVASITPDMMLPLELVYHEDTGDIGYYPFEAEEK